MAQYLLSNDNLLKMFYYLLQKLQSAAIILRMWATFMKKCDYYKGADKQIDKKFQFLRMILIGV